MTERLVIVGGGVHRHDARIPGQAPRPRGRAPGTRGGTARRVRAQLRSGLGQRPGRRRRDRARRCGPASGGNASAADVPGVGFRPRGSTDGRADRRGSRDLRRGWRPPTQRPPRVHLPGSRGGTSANPAVRGDVLGGLLSTRDASVEPAQVLGAMRAHLAATTAGYTGCPAARSSNSTATRRPRPPRRMAPRRPGRAGHRRHPTGIAGAHLSAAPIRRCRLQMMQTAPLGEELTTSIADGDSFRYYPAYRDADLASLGTAAPDRRRAPDAAADGAARARRADHRRHPRLRRAVRLRRRGGAVRPSARGGRGDPRPRTAAGACAAGPGIYSETTDGAHLPPQPTSPPA